MDICATSRLVLTLDMGVQTVESDWQGPIPQGTVGLLLGRSSTTLKGLIVHPGVIDSDFQGQVKIMLSSPKGITVITPGNKIAQMLILPSQHDLYAYKNTSQGTKGFGSSGEPLACLTLGLQDRSLLTLTI